MRRYIVWLVLAACAASFIPGCGNPIKRPPTNVFPGSETYAARVKDFKITPGQAYDLAHEAAEADNRLHHLSKTPTVVTKRSYVFSLPQGSGATLQGYHVNGDNGEVKFVNEKKIVYPTR